MPSDQQRLAAHLAAILDSSTDAIVSKDTAGIIESWNKSAERMFGYTAAEPIGRSIRMIIPVELQHEDDRILSRIRKGQRVEHFETVRGRKGGAPNRRLNDNLPDHGRKRQRANELHVAIQKALAAIAA